jgi:lysozyme family protein
MNFDQAFDFLIGNEGGYSNNPADPGGETNWGISKRSYPRLVDIKHLTKDEAKAIYLCDFWDRIPGISEAVKFQMFDAAVNHGSDNAVRMLQRAVGVTQDGEWGKVSAAAYIKLSEQQTLMRFIAARIEFMTSLKKWDEFGKGWTRRIANNLRIASANDDKPEFPTIQVQI